MRFLVIKYFGDAVVSPCLLRQGQLPHSAPFPLVTLATNLVVKIEQKLPTPCTYRSVIPIQMGYHYLNVHVITA